jgi:hypothetical protein
VIGVHCGFCNHFVHAIDAHPLIHQIPKISRTKLLTQWAADIPERQVEQSV